MAAGMMAVEGVEKEAVAEICRRLAAEEKRVFVAVVNSQHQIVIAGEEAALAAAEELLNRRGARLERLDVSAPFHTPLLADAAQKTKHLLAGIKLNRPRWPIFSTISGRRREYFLLDS